MSLRSVLVAGLLAILVAVALGYFLFDWKRPTIEGEAKSSPPDPRTLPANEAFPVTVERSVAEPAASSEPPSSTADASAPDATPIPTAIADGNSYLRWLEESSLEPDFGDLKSAQFDGWFEPKTRGPDVDGLAFARGRDAPVPGLTLTFGPGSHRLEETRLRPQDGEPFPADVTLQGAGRGETLLQLSRVRIPSNVQRLRLRHLTVDTRNDGLFLLTGSLTVDLYEVRVVRFDGGHGDCVLFRANEGVLLRASECEFLGGFGVHPGAGSLLGGWPIVARFQECRFELMDRFFQNLQTLLSGRVLFRDCQFLDLDPFPGDGTHGRVRFEGSAAGLPRDPDRPITSYARQLTELFADAPR